MPVNVTVSVGEALDKLTILRIKAHRVKDPQKLEIVRAELEDLGDCLNKENYRAATSSTEFDKLYLVNAALWDLENQIRTAIATKDEHKIAEIATAICRANDERYRIKNAINTHWDSEHQEVKQLPKY